MPDLNPEPPKERAPDLDGCTGGFSRRMVRLLTSGLTVTPGHGRIFHAIVPR
ncbi:hypothetical protein ACPCBC_01480 [Streptomyces incarnatus]